MAGGGGGRGRKNWRQISAHTHQNQIYSERQTEREGKEVRASMKAFFMVFLHGVVFLATVELEGRATLDH